MLPLLYFISKIQVQRADTGKKNDRYILQAHRLAVVRGFPFFFYPFFSLNTVFSSLSYID